MPIYGIATESEKDNLSAQLAFLYLEKADTTGLTASEFASKFFEVKQEISEIVSSHASL